MLKFENRGNLIEVPGDRPILPEVIERLYLDFETTSGDAKQDSLNPWHNCKPKGFAFTWDEFPLAWYCPMDVPLSEKYLQMIMARTKVWVNHNVKYDAHVYANNIEPLPEHIILKDTVVGSKLIDSDRGFGKGGYGLDTVARDWLHEDISIHEERLQVYLHKNKDYGAIPDDIMAEYACQDVLTTRRLDKFIDAQMPEEVNDVWQTETALTHVLFEIEQNGLQVNLIELQKRELLFMHAMLQLEAQLNDLIGRPIRPHTNADCYEVLCIQYGLPIAGFTESGEASFGKHELLLYLSHPLAPKEIVEKIMQYRKLHTHINFFVRPYQELSVDEILHSSYNQLVRTGRMASKWPNSQQLDKLAKELIHPRPSNAFLSIDYSQIEFRTIVHYIQDEACIEAFTKNPDEDFHQMIADMCGVSRRPAKTINFMVGFGAGKRKTLKVLSVMGEVIADIKGQIDELIAGTLLTEEDRGSVFNRMAEERALDVYNRYHALLPGIKSTSKRAESIAAYRGYVRNLAGRRRHIPPDHAYIAFNTLNQSTAADIMKERTVAVAQLVKGTQIKLVASVHDELLLEGPAEQIEDERTIRDIVACMEDSKIKLRVPIRCSAGTSRVHWREAGSDEVSKTVIYARENVTKLDHLRLSP